MFAAGSEPVRAEKAAQFCMNDSVEETVHFVVEYKDGNRAEKHDSEQFKKGEKCVSVPTEATDVTMDIYKQTFIVWSKVCSKTWTAAPEEDIHVILHEGESGLVCEGL